MRTYIIKRLLLAIPTLIGVSMLVFSMIRLLPGDLVQQIAGDNAVTPEFEARIERELGLDKHAFPISFGRDAPFIAFHSESQYLIWLWDVARLDFGEQLRIRAPVNDRLLDTMPVTIEIAIISLIISLLIALPIGTLSAIRQDSAADYMARSISIGFLAVPNFWLGTMIIVYTSLWWGLATPTPQEYQQIWEDPIQNLKFLIFPFGYFLPLGPTVLLGIGLSGAVMRLMRTQMLEVLRQDYVRTAWAKGLRERSVILRHALKNAMIPVITVIGLQVPILVGGSVVVENIYNVPGMGRWLLEAILSRDYTSVQAIALVTAVSVIVSNLVVDVTYAYLDPRIRYS